MKSELYAHSFLDRKKNDNNYSWDFVKKPTNSGELVGLYFLASRIFLNKPVWYRRVIYC